jgi:hypothetical protein
MRPERPPLPERPPWLTALGLVAAVAAVYANSLDGPDPAYVAAYAHLGVVLQNLGQPGAAIQRYREALRLRPDFAFVRENLRTLGAEADTQAEP